jgi:hypothetical protein
MKVGILRLHRLSRHERWKVPDEVAKVDEAGSLHQLIGEDRNATRLTTGDELGVDDGSEQVEL